MVHKRSRAACTAVAVLVGMVASWRPCTTSTGCRMLSYAGSCSEKEIARKPSSEPLSQSLACDNKDADIDIVKFASRAA